MKKIVFISIIFAVLSTAAAQNVCVSIDSTCLKKTNDCNLNSQMLAYAQDTSKTKTITHKETREMLEAKKREYFTKEMDLSNDEVKVFFPVLNQFENKHRKIIHERRKILETIEAKKNTMNDTEAKQMNKQIFELQKQEFELIIEYQTIFETILSPKKMLLFHKAHENFMRGLLKSMGTGRKNSSVTFPNSKML